MRCEHADELPDGRLVVSSAERNRGPILKGSRTRATENRARAGGRQRNRAACGSFRSGTEGVELATHRYGRSLPPIDLRLAGD